MENARNQADDIIKEARSRAKEEHDLAVFNAVESFIFWITFIITPPFNDLYFKQLNKLIKYITEKTKKGIRGKTGSNTGRNTIHIDFH